MIDWLCYCLFGHLCKAVMRALPEETKLIVKYPDCNIAVAMWRKDGCYVFGPIKIREVNDGLGMDAGDGGDGDTGDS